MSGPDIPDEAVEAATNVLITRGGVRAALAAAQPLLVEAARAEVEAAPDRDILAALIHAQENEHRNYSGGIGGFAADAILASDWFAQQQAEMYLQGVKNGQAQVERERDEARAQVASVLALADDPDLIYDGAADPLPVMEVSRLRAAVSPEAAAAFVRDVKAAERTRLAALVRDADRPRDVFLEPDPDTAARRMQAHLARLIEGEKP